MHIEINTNNKVVYIYQLEVKELHRVEEMLKSLNITDSTGWKIVSKVEYYQTRNLYNNPLTTPTTPYYLYCTTAESNSNGELTTEGMEKY